MGNNFESFKKDFFDEEGGYVNHKRDKGGMTNHGITAAFYEGCSGKKPTEKIMRDLSKDTAGELLKNCIWDPLRAEELPGGVAHSMALRAAQYGNPKAIGYFQNLLGMKPDKLMGNQTVEALKNTDARALIDRNYSDHYNSVASNKTFGNGLMDRTSRDWRRSSKEAGRSDEEIAVAERNMPWYVAPPPPPPPPRRPELLGLTPREVQQRLEQKSSQEQERALEFGYPLQGPRMQFQAARVPLAPSAEGFDGVRKPRQAEPVPLPPRRPETLGMGQKGAFLQLGLGSVEN